MINQSQASQIQSALATAQTIFIALPLNPNFDQVAAGLALYLSLGITKKSVAIGCSTEMTVGFSSLVGVDKIENSLKGSKDSLSISFDYIEEAIEKVSYNIEDDKFNLVIKPRLGHPPLDSDKVEFSYTGGKVDLIFTIGASSLESLGNLYKDNQEAFKETQVVNLDNNSRNQQYGQINLVDPSAASFSEEVAKLIRLLRLLTDRDIGTNLFQGIERATNRFSSPKVNADTFEAAALCLKMGARREVKLPNKKSKSTSPLKPMPAKVSALKEPAREEEEETEKPKPDWFEPKIYKGEDRI
ncbi:hypothetical protein A2Z41_01550 [Microgenomates group bacterium RBG_19FT_COMBO_39_10]|nr:MAG: hypothetical protein A2Z41_01550 [Microgenomates group bacterium RBG_19FT_COMBO_39_10]